MNQLNDGMGMGMGMEAPREVSCHLKCWRSHGTTEAWGWAEWSPGYFTTSYITYYWIRMNRNELHCAVGLLEYYYVFSSKRAIAFNLLGLVVVQLTKDPLYQHLKCDAL